jgi:hypothetical protein
VAVNAVNTGLLPPASAGSLSTIAAATRVIAAPTRTIAFSTLTPLYGTRRKEPSLRIAPIPAAEEHAGEWSNLSPHEPFTTDRSAGGCHRGPSAGGRVLIGCEPHRGCELVRAGDVGLELLVCSPGPAHVGVQAGAAAGR